MPLPTEIDWPVSLGCAQRTGYQGTPNSMFATLEVEDGPSRFRLISDEEKRDYVMTFFFNETQLAEFEDFVFTTLKGGELWFNMPVLTGMGMVPHIVHLTGQRRVTPHEMRMDLYVAEIVVEAYAAGTPIPPPFEPDPDPVDARTPDDPATDIYDGGDLATETGTNIINSLTPEVW